VASGGALVSSGERLGRTPAVMVLGSARRLHWIVADDVHSGRPWCERSDLRISTSHGNLTG